MHRRLQFGMRENPASDRRYGSRVGVASEEASNYAGGNHREPANSDDKNGHSASVLKNAAHYASTGGVRSVFASEELGRTRQHSTTADRESFEPLITSDQAARLLGNIHVKTLQRYARLGRLPGYQIGGHWYFRASELDAWLRHQINSKCQSVR